MFLNLSHYCFFSISDPQAVKIALEQRFVRTTIVGTVLIAKEGVNFNLAGLTEELKPIVTEWLSELGCPDLKMKESVSADLPFKRLKIKVKPEIVTLGMPELNVPQWRAPHMSAEEFRDLLRQPSENWVILDTRNDFEYELGSFAGARPAGMKSFRNFPRAVQDLPKDKKVVMFCTGGIRCEKASAYLKQEGYPEVYQLDGGILRYFEKCGDEGFKGRCFVFDERIALDGDLRPDGVIEGENPGSR